MEDLPVEEEEATQKETQTYHDAGAGPEPAPENVREAQSHCPREGKHRFLQADLSGVDMLFSSSAVNPKTL